MELKINVTIENIFTKKKIIINLILRSIDITEISKEKRKRLDESTQPKFIRTREESSFISTKQNDRLALSCLLYI